MVGTLIYEGAFVFAMYAIEYTAISEGGNLENRQ